jgi:glucose/arabinose dehydrogenase
MTGRARRAPRAVVAVVAAVLAGTVLSGCGVVGAAGQVPIWVPKPNALPPLDGPSPQLPGEPGQGPGGPNGQVTPEPGRSTAPGQRNDPNVVASRLREPWGLTVLPDGTALVGERATGRILQVQPDRSAPARAVMRLAGVDAAGDGGLLGLAASPAYAEDRLLFAYVTTSTDNRILRFELGGVPAAILTGIPRGRTDNGGRIEFGPDGDLYVGTGDTGDARLAQDRASLAGKILRVDIFGHPAKGNPDPRSPVYSSGHGSVAGLCWDGQGRLLATDNAGGSFELDRISAGANYGWPAVRGKARRSGYTDPTLTFDAGSGPVGGCAVVRFGLFVASLTGRKLLGVALSGNRDPGPPKPLLERVYGRLRTVQAAADGALWLTTANRDGRGRPVPADDRVIRILPPPDSTVSPV